MKIRIRPFVLLVILFGSICAAACTDSSNIDDASGSTANYTGGATCVSCHEKETNLWKSSHHDLAMQRASSQTVLGDFNDAEFSYGGVTSRFYQRQDSFFV